MIDDEDGLEDKDERDEEFSEYGDDEKAANLTYADFFAPPKTDRQKKRKVEYRANDDEDYGSFGEEEEPMKDDESLTENADAAIAVKDLFNQNDENDDTAKSLSSFEREQLRMQKNIEQLEEENIQEKSWQMKGEVNAKKRPINSLLEEDLDFDQGSKPVPIITEEVTQSLEEIIKARILDGTWDDVERCLAPAELAALVNRPRKQIEISDEKSKKSLAEEYEDEYQKQKRLQTDPNHDSRSEELKKEHREIESMYKSLCGKLDALSNWHFTPKAGHSEMKITATTTETPAIEMEEIIPVHVSDGQLLAPHEVYEPKKSELSLKSKEEMTSQEKDKLRRAKKQEVRKEKNRREQDKKLMGKLNPGMGNRHSRENALKMLDGHKVRFLVIILMILLH
jgi:U3 small nucleolar RNA-associated protein MPP10